MGGRKNEVWDRNATVRCCRLGQLLVEAAISSPYWFPFLRAKKSRIIKEMSNKKSLDFIDHICPSSY